MYDNHGELTKAERIGQRIKAERTRDKNRSMTQVQLALKVHTTQNTISNWETGTVMPPMDQLINLAKVFGCDVAYLLCDYDDRNITDMWISDTTGLSVQAIQCLKNRHGILHDYELEIINTLLENPTFWDDVLNRLRAAAEIMSYPQYDTDSETKAVVHRKSNNFGTPQEFNVGPQTAAEIQLQFATDSIKQLFKEMVM